MRKILYIIILIIGFLQTIGYLTDIKPIRNIGIVTSASPLPIVFTEVKGVETFASNFYMQWETNNGILKKVQITPKLYSKLKGPYNRRNIFGAAIAYGPVLPKENWNAILKYGICNDILTNELGVEVEKESFSVLIETRSQGRDNKWTLKTECQ